MKPRTALILLILGCLALGLGTALPQQAGYVAPTSVTVNGTTCTLGSTCSPSPTVSSKMVTSTRNLTTASGSQAVTGFGFTPSACIGNGTVAGPSTTSTYTTISGMVDSALNQSVTYMTAGQYTLGGNFLAASDGTGNQQTAVVSSFASDTVNLSWTKTASPTGTFTFNILCFK